MSDWRSRAVNKDPLVASRNAIMQRNAEGIQNPYQTLPTAPLDIQIPAMDTSTLSAGNVQPTQAPNTPLTVNSLDWHSRARPVSANTQPTADWRSRANAVKPKGFIDNMKVAVTNRTGQMQQAADAYVSGDQGALSTGYQQAAAGASILPDALLNAANSVIPQGVKDVAAKLGETGIFVAKNTIGRLPSIGGGTVAEQLPKDLESISRGDTEFKRNLRATGQLVNLYGAGKTLDVAAKLATPTVEAAAKSGITNLKSYAKDTSSGANPIVNPPQLNQADLGKIAGQSFDEAKYLGADFTPDQVSNKLGLEVRRILPKPIAGKVLTTEQKVLADNLKEYEPLIGKNLTLDDIQNLDQTLTQKITKYVDPRTGQLDATGRELYVFQQKMRKIVDSVDTAGNDALTNGRTLWRAKSMLSDLEAIAERAALSPNTGKALQAGYKALYLDKDRISSWPKEAKELLRKAAAPNATDAILDFAGSRLPAMIGLGTGNPLAAAGAQTLGAAARGGKEAVIATRGAKVQQSVIDNAVNNLRPVNIPAPETPPTLQLAAPDKMSRLPMTDTQVNIAQQLMTKPTRLPEGPKTVTPASQLTKLSEKLGKQKSSELTASIQMLKDGSISQNQFVKDAVRDFKLTPTQARSLAKEVKTYGDK